MKLTRYKVTKFKSVDDSGWIDCEDVTTLVGINEAGKSNLLLALWKLNPASGGEIDLVDDVPASEYNIIRDTKADVCFISAEFEISAETAAQIAEEVECDASDLTTVTFKKYYDNTIECILPKNPKSTKTAKEKVEREYAPGEEIEYITRNIEYDEDKLDDCLIKHMPKFVYYSNFGNLSSRLYLPHVITWLDNGTVAGVDTNRDQLRTLRVLFKYVNLQPREIYEIGRPENSNLNSEQVEKAHHKREERSRLLQSAGTKLTTDFRSWWHQGKYNFRFVADGDYFRIDVSDEHRPSEISLDKRSTGLQWFLSFFLIFLVESEGSHNNAILLLDEAGQTLHPTAQKDLCAFFNDLSKKNQIIHTTHSPFIVDTNHIDRCKVVYMDEHGYTVASNDLRKGSDKKNEESIYAVHAALGLSVSDILLQGCRPIIVEGASDQIYLNTIKNILISIKAINPREELVFVPSGGVKGIPGIVSILGSKKGSLPLVLIDSDKSGSDFKARLTTGNGLYKDEKGSVLSVGDFVKKENVEIEDLIPFELMAKAVDKLFKDVDEDENGSFEDAYDDTLPIVPQLEAFAKEHGLNLSNWKVDFAKKVKAQMLKVKEYDVKSDYIKVWKKLFEKLYK